MNSPMLYGQIQSFSCNSFYMVDRMGLGGTMLHYLTLWKALVSIHRPVHSKITLTYLPTWQTDHYSHRRLAFKVLLNTMAALSQALLKFLCTYCSKNLPERAPTKTQLRVLSMIGQLHEWACPRSTIKSSLPFSLPLCHSRGKLSQALSRFSVLQATESWAGPGNEATQFSDHCDILHYHLRKYQQVHPCDYLERRSIRLYLLFEIQSLTLFWHWVMARYYLMQCRCADHFTFTLEEDDGNGLQLQKPGCQNSQAIETPTILKAWATRTKVSSGFMCLKLLRRTTVPVELKVHIHWIWFGLWWVEEQRSWPAENEGVLYLEYTWPSG